MSRFVPIIDANQLPKPGDGFERAVLDLKSTASPKPGFHHAKDVAAFANHLGGTLLIGAQETDGRVREYAPLSESVVSAIKDAFSQAVRDRFSPRPLIDFARLPMLDGLVLAVSVWPYAGQIVGVAVKCKKDHDGFGEEAHAFPVRVGVDSGYLLPEQLPMFITPDIRRNAILLNAIPKDCPVNVYVGRRNSPEGYVENQLVLDEVDELANVVSFLPANGSHGAGQQSFPLDKVNTVFKDPIGGWRVYIHKFD
ncbi:MAG TPA: ATP-binding protein [Acidimicrobiia bacterium]